jgi:hypothetical protein
VVLGTVAPFETPAFEGDAFFLAADADDFATVFLAGDFLAADAGDFATVFLGAVAVFFAGVVSSALQASAARAAMAAHLSMVRLACSSV